MNTLEQLQQVFRDVFDDNKVELYPEMTAADYLDWDSIAHIQLIVAVEDHFGIKFTTNDVLRLKNIGEFVALIDAGLA